MPFAPGATGNIATEELLYALERMGEGLAVSLDGILAPQRLWRKPWSAPCRHSSTARGSPRGRTRQGWLIARPQRPRTSGPQLLPQLSHCHIDVPLPSSEGWDPLSRASISRPSTSWGWRRKVRSR